eukprot:gene236-247_t
MESRRSLWESIQQRLPLLYVFVSGIGFSFQALAVKLVAEKGLHGAFHLAWIRGFFQFFLSSSFIYFSDERKNGTAPRLFGDSSYVTCMLILRSVTGFLGIAAGFSSTEYISVGDSAVLVMLSPTFAAILGYFLLKEPWNLPEMCATVLSLAGAVFIARPPALFGSTLEEHTTQGSFYYGVALALVSAVGSAFVFIIVRILGTSAKIPWPYVTFSQSLGQIFLAPPSAFLFGVLYQRNVTVEVALIIIGAGLIGAFSQAAMTVGLQREKSASATAMRMSDVIFGYIWQVLFTNDGVDWLSIVGAVLVSMSILVVVIFKQDYQRSPTKNEKSLGNVSSIELGKISLSSSQITYTMVSLGEDESDNEEDHEWD